MKAPLSVADLAANDPDPATSPTPAASGHAHAVDW
jgi:hypothetical protein